MHGQQNVKISSHAQFHIRGFYFFKNKISNQNEYILWAKLVA